MEELIIKDNPHAIEEINDDIADALEEVCEEITDKSKDECPVVTGALRDSLYTVMDKENLEGYITSDLDYFTYVNIGTRNTDPNPFVDRAVRSVL